MFSITKLIELREKRAAVDYNGQEENDKYVAELDRQIAELIPQAPYIERFSNLYKRYTSIHCGIRGVINEIRCWDIVINGDGVRYNYLPDEQKLASLSSLRNEYERKLHDYERNIDSENFSGNRRSWFRSHIVGNIRSIKALLEELDDYLNRIKYVSGEVKFDDYNMVVRAEGVTDENSDKVKYLEVNYPHAKTLIILPEGYKMDINRSIF